MKLFYITGVVQLVSATTVLVPPDVTVCPGDDVTFNCSVTLSTCGVLSWSVNNIAVGSFLDVTGQLGTRASNPDFPGVVASITDINVDMNNISSSLTITSAGINVPHGSQILCTDDNERDQRNLVITMIELNTTVYPTLRSARVIVQSRDLSALECITAYQIEVEPTVPGQPTLSPINSTSNTITVSELNFCISNYSFRITAYNRNDITFNDSVLNVSGDLNALDIIIQPFQNSSILQWNLMRSDHPENCNVTYKVTFNGISLPSRISTTQILQNALTDAGFPFCRSTPVLITPYLPAHGLVNTQAEMTTYLAIPRFSGPKNVIPIPRFVRTIKNVEPTTVFQVEVKWDAIPPDTFGSDVNIDTDVTFNCSLSAGETRKCNLSTEHIFQVSDDKPFGKTFPVTITVAYLECTNFITDSSITVTATITEFPQLFVHDTFVNVTLMVNTTLVPNGSVVEFYIPESTLKTKVMIFGGMLSTRVDELTPGTPYKYKITFKDQNSDAIIDRSIYGEFTTSTVIIDPMTDRTGLIVGLTLGFAIPGIVIILFVIIWCLWLCKRCFIDKSRKKQSKEKSEEDGGINASND